MPDPLILLEAVAIGLATGVAYATVRFARKHYIQGVPFNAPLYGATLVVSCAASVALALSGQAVTFVALEQVFLANFVLLYFVEDVLKAVFHELGVFQNYAGSPAGTSRSRDRR